MPDPSIPTAPLLAFYSSDLYRHVGRVWRWQPFVYLALLLTLSWIPFTIGVANGWNRFVAEAPAFTEQIPAITIENGRASADVEQPYVIENPETGVTEMIIDTTGEVTSLEHTTARVLLTESRVFMKNKPNETRVYDLAGVESFVLDGERVQHWLDVSRIWVPIALFPLMVVGSLVYRLVQGLFYALLGLGVARVRGNAIGFPAVYRITLVALTPAILLKTLLWAVGLGPSFMWVVYFLVAIAYVLFGTEACGDGADSPE